MSQRPATKLSSAVERLATTENSMASRKGRPAFQ